MEAVGKTGCQMVKVFLYIKSLLLITKRNSMKTSATAPQYYVAFHYL